MKLSEFENGKYAVEKHLTFSNGFLMQCINYNITKKHNELIISHSETHKLILTTKPDQDLLLKHLIPIGDILNHDQIENIINETHGDKFDDPKFEVLYELFASSESCSNDLDKQIVYLDLINSLSNSIKKDNRKYLKDVTKHQ